MRVFTIDGQGYHKKCSEHESSPETAVKKSKPFCAAANTRLLAMSIMIVIV